MWALVIVSAIQGLTPDARSLASPWTLDRLDDLLTTSGSADPGAAQLPGTDRLGDPDRNESLTVSTMAGVPEGSSAIGRRRELARSIQLFLTPEGYRPIGRIPQSPQSNVRLAPQTRPPALAVLCRLTC